MIFLADFPRDSLMGATSRSEEDMLKLVESLETQGFPITHVQGKSLREILAKMKPNDHLFGTVALLQTQPQFRLSRETPWLQGHFAGSRRIATARNALKKPPVRPFSPYFIKSVEEKGRPAPTKVTKAQTNRRITALLAEDPQREVLIGPIFKILAEERFFAVQGKIVTSHTYSGNESQSPQRRKLVETFMGKTSARNVVIDVATIPTGSLIIETNPLFCAGLYNIDPCLILPGVTKKAIKAEHGLDWP